LRLGYHEKVTLSLSVVLSTTNAKWSPNMSDNVLSGQRWQQPTVSWSYTGSAALAPEVQRAFDRWDAELGIDFVKTPNPGAADIEVTFGPIDGPSINRASTLGSITSGFTLPDNIYNGTTTITFDSAENWTFNAATGNYELPGGISFYGVALHEIGHALGLDHPTNTSTIMFATASATVPDLTSFDIAGARQLYGAETTPGDSGGGGTGGGDGGTGPSPIINAGTRKNDTIYGDSLNDTLSGQKGNDKLFGYAGEDNLDLGDGNDEGNGGDGNDVINQSRVDPGQHHIRLYASRQYL
jgi:hypothetical protein